MGGFRDGGIGPHGPHPATAAAAAAAAVAAVAAAVAAAGAAAGPAAAGGRPSPRASADRRVPTVFCITCICMHLQMPFASNELATLPLDGMCPLAGGAAGRRRLLGAPCLSPHAAAAAVAAARPTSSASRSPPGRVTGLSCRGTTQPQLQHNAQHGCLSHSSLQLTFIENACSADTSWYHLAPVHC